MTIKYTKKLTLYFLFLSILLVKNSFANIPFGNGTVNFSFGGRWENNTNFTTSQNYGTYPHGRYITDRSYFRFDATINGTYPMNNVGNLIWELNTRLYTLKKTESKDLPRIAYVGIDSKLGTLQIGKFYTPTDDLMFLNSVNGDLFAGMSANYLLESNLDASYRTDGAQEEVTYVGKYNAAIQYSLPKDLVKGLEIKLLVATDPNANQNGLDKQISTRYPWGFDSLIKYTADSGFFIAASYAGAHTLGMNGEFKGAINLDPMFNSLKYILNTDSKHYVVTSKIGYNQNNFNITAGYRDIYYKKVLYTSTIFTAGTDEDVTNTVTYYSVDHSYALSFDAGYKLGNNNFAIGYEVKPKYTDLRLNLITVLYGYNFSDNVTLEAQLNHFFNTERPEPEDFRSTKNGFIKNSVTSLTTRLKFTF